MSLSTILRRSGWVFALLIPVLILLPSGSARAQSQPCEYDRNAPSLDHARLYFKSLNYKCAEQELLDLLQSGATSLKGKADAHVLLAAVYYAMEKDSTEKRSKVLEQFTAAFQQYREWKGELDITSSDFVSLMEEARRRVDSQREGLATRPESLVPAVRRECPASTPAWISTGIFAAATGFLVYTSSRVSSKWDDYESDPAHPTDLYDSYKSANSLRNVVGVATIGGGVIAGYLWYKHFSASKDCAPGGQARGPGMRMDPAAGMVLMTYTF